MKEHQKTMLEFMSSEEGKRSAKEFFEKIRQKEEMEVLQLERFHKRFGENLNEIIGKIIQKYSSNSYVRKEYNLGREPMTPLFFFLYEYGVKYGTYTEEEEYTTSFNDGAYIVGDYVFGLLHGQGSVIRVWDRIIKLKKKVYIPVEGKELTENGFILIATGSATITDKKAKFDFCQKHLKEIETNVLSNNDLAKIISIAMQQMADWKNEGLNDYGTKIKIAGYANRIVNLK